MENYIAYEVVMRTPIYSYVHSSAQIIFLPSNATKMCNPAPPFPHPNKSRCSKHADDALHGKLACLGFAAGAKLLLEPLDLD
jgi:hypothetical protein